MMVEQYTDLRVLPCFFVLVIYRSECTCVSECCMSVGAQGGKKRSSNTW